MEGRGPDRAPPGPPGPAVAVLALVASMALAVALTLGAASRGDAPAPSLPFDPGPLEGTHADGSPGTVRVPGVVLYVDDGCPWCALELRRAASTSATVASPLTVVVSPRSDPSGAHVPGPLRSRLLHDTDGSIARSLGVRGVPFRAVLDANGLVSTVRVGLSSPAGDGNPRPPDPPTPR